MQNTPSARRGHQQGMGSRSLAAAAERVLAAAGTETHRAQQQWTDPHHSSWQGVRTLHQHLQRGAGLSTSSWQASTPPRQMLQQQRQRQQQRPTQQQQEWVSSSDSSWWQDPHSGQQHHLEGPPGSSLWEGDPWQQQAPQEGEQPAPPLQWYCPPLLLLPELVCRGAPRLTPDPPLDIAGASPAVRMFLSQARRTRGSRKTPSTQTILNMMWRVKLQHYSSTDWAASHQTRDNGVVLATVDDTPAAQAAARAAVSAGHVVVGEGDTELAVPVAWAPFSQPAGCVVVTVHQLPPQYARKGVGTMLLKAAAQPGEVVAEFLGGSTLTGDAQLSCPCTDTVVLWVKPPPDDILLTRMPSYFDSGIHGRPAVTIQVACRPSHSPQLWPAVTQQLLRRRAAALEQFAAALGTTAHQGQGQQQQQRGWVWGASMREQQHSQQQPYPPPPPPPRPPAPHSLAQQPQQQTRPDREDSSDMLLDSEPEAAAQRPTLQPEQQQQQHSNDMLLDSEPEAAAQRPSQQQAQQQALPGNDMQLDSEPEAAVQRPQQQLQRQQQQQQQQQGAARLPPDPFSQDRQWAQQQDEDMLAMAVQLANDEATVPRSLSQRQRQELLRAFRRHFRTDLQQQVSPSLAELRSWLRQQLGIQPLGYGSDSDPDSGVDSGADASDEGAPASVAGERRAGDQRSRQQGPSRHRRRTHQQHQQQQPAQPTRRSERINAGRMSAGYASLYGPAGSTQREGRVGHGNSQQVSGSGISPSTPAATHNPRRARQSAQGSA
jgi:hypothetical protein